MYPTGCHWTTYGQFSLYTMSGVKLNSLFTNDADNFNFLEFDFLNVGQYLLIVQNTYSPNDVNDFTLKAYSKEKVTFTQLTSTSLT